MPRKPREFVAGGIFHVFNRGNNRKTIFKERENFECFKGMLKKGQERESVKIYHYCLMSTHFHMLLKSEKSESLSRFMHWVQLGYARYYKKKYGTTGHVFEERYRSPRIAKESYYLQCGRYIERNPLKAKLVKQVEDYPYSSARHYVKGICDSLITDNIYFQGLGRSQEERCQNYRRFVKMDEPYEALISDQLLKY